MEAGKLRHKVELWGNVKVQNELHEWENRPEKIKTINARIIPQTGGTSQQSGIETIISRTTHKFVIRYLAGKDIRIDNWFIYTGKRFDILYILNPFFRNESLEIFCEEVMK